jgi:hypothetical protein
LGPSRDSSSLCIFLILPLLPFHNSKDGFNPKVKNLKHMNKVIMQLGLPKKSSFLS